MYVLPGIMWLVLIVWHQIYLQSRCGCD